MNDINSISNRTILRILALITLFGLAIFAAVVLKRELMWLLISFFFAVAINPAVDLFSKFMPKRSRIMATGLVLLVFVLLLAFMIVTLVPPLISQTQTLITRLPDIANTLQNSNTPLGEFAQRYNLVPLIKANQAKFSEGITAVGGSALDLARTALSSIAATLSILAITFFMSAEGPRWLDTLRRFQPKSELKKREALALEMYHAVTGWVNGNLLTSLIAAVAVAIMLTIVHIPYAIPLGILVGVFDLLPLIGATLGAAIVILVCLFSSVSAAVIMLVFFLVYQQVENHVLQPYVYSKTVEMSPLLVLVSAILGASLAGLVGALLAIPIAACAQILLRHAVHEQRSKRLIR